jgi:dihydroneopterin aldolase/2-amino-4-hydroxy-6-hydroxymethyldihydropteridine diphosphokinase
MPRVFVAVGSNVAPEGNVTRALRMLEAEIGILGISTFYRTAALHRPQDPSYVNGVVEVSDALGPLDLKEQLQRIELAVGRERAADRYAPRTVDLDLVLYGDQVSSLDGLRLPHPDIRERRFVAIPLLELAPDLILPDSATALRAVVSSLPPCSMEPLRDFTRRLRTEVGHGSAEGGEAHSGAAPGDG